MNEIIGIFFTIFLSSCFLFLTFCTGLLIIEVCNAIIRRFKPAKNTDKCIKEIEKWARNNINCSHQLCSTAESIYEEKFGKEILNIIENHKK